MFLLYAFGACDIDPVSSGKRRIWGTVDDVHANVSPLCTVLIASSESTQISVEVCVFCSLKWCVRPDRAVLPHDRRS